VIDSTAYAVLGAILAFSLIFTCVVFYRSEQRIPTYSLLELIYALRKTSRALPASLFALALLNTLFLLLAQADASHHIFAALICWDIIHFSILVAGYRRHSLLKKRIRTLQLELQEQASKGQQEAPVPPSSFASPATKSEEAAARCPSCGTSLAADAVCPTCYPFASESMGTASMSSDEESNPYEEHLPFVENLAANSQNQSVPVPPGTLQETNEKQKQVEELIQQYGQEHTRPPRRSASALLLSALICIFYASSNWWSTLQSTDPLSASKLTLLAGWCVLILFACGFIAFTLITMRSRDL
jgi:hypothetical protein